MCNDVQCESHSLLHTWLTGILILAVPKWMHMELYSAVPLLWFFAPNGPSHHFDHIHHLSSIVQNKTVAERSRETVSHMMASYYWLSHHNSCINFMYYFTVCLGSLWPSSGKIFTRTLHFSAIFPYNGQCLHFGEVMCYLPISMPMYKLHARYYNSNIKMFRLL
jgi:hypothetical protein